jgi:hypothetical protein
MARKITIGGELARLALKDFPDTPILTLAKKLYKESPAVYTSVENARDILRNHAGLKGDLKRATHQKSSGGLYRKPKYGQELKDALNPFKLPESFEDDWSPYILPTLTRRLLVLSDIHIPYHNINALT